MAQQSKKKKRNKVIAGVLIAGGVGVALYFLLKKKKLRGSVIVDDVIHVGPVDDSELASSNSNNPLLEFANNPSPGTQYSVRWNTAVGGVKQKFC